MAEPVLYSFRRCPYAMRARLALAVSGLRCELREVKLGAKPQAMLEASPKGTVPVLVLADGRVIDQSLDIMRWALVQNDPEGWLERDDADLIAVNDGRFKRDLDGYKYHERHDGDARAYREAGMAFLRDLEARLASSPHLAGAERGIADAAVMPFVRQFAAVDAEWFAAQPLSHLQAWLDGHLASELFAAIMVRPKPWQPGDPVLFFP
ncbi:glutathione S-transferase [Novosphingobium chloroacetimidivorans]|uniref:Glutathione S-transferase n=1 Tax=Novosphingobium chloroacetimidivorans TaxID=1428314 RepID=A0A7W7K8N0_9SPHN|nr:glutathione S-transferase [Novosphingobium chloroacetimidivorans]MBB4858299.1 glutathione S-transferase [Novosphingobium chloroacetimidivorans]